MKKIIYVLLPLLVVFYSCGNSNNNSKGDDAKQIVKPGVTYITESFGTATDMFGGAVYVSMEFTLYTDGTVAAKIIETNKESYYGNSNSYEHPVEGIWKEVSKHDKRFIEICIEGDYRDFNFYIDEDHRVYADDVNNNPVSMSEK